jgi:aminoglycoside phosphotransferase family enzyme
MMTHAIDMNPPLTPFVVAALLRPETYPHPAEDIEMLETHISWVFLAGPYAYKVKKPVELGFLDFTTLEQRRHFCEEELRLNRRLAPQLYLDLVELRGSPKTPRIGGSGPLLEYALRMRRFAQRALASRMLVEGRLTPERIERLATRLAQFHAALPPAPSDVPYGTTEAVLHDALQNFDQIAAITAPNGGGADALARLGDWTEREFMLRYSEMHERREAGMIRECHGDLHLRNIVELDGELVPFDCIEFNPGLRWIDVMNEVAFLFMDLLDRGADTLAWRFLDAYLEANGAYSGLSVLRFYVVYRAMVRAKVHLLRACQQGLDRAESSRLRKACESYLVLAQRCTTLGRPGILLMHGFSACGKSDRLVARPGARRAAGALGCRAQAASRSRASRAKPFSGFQRPLRTGRDPGNVRTARGSHPIRCHVRLHGHRGRDVSAARSTRRCATWPRAPALPSRSLVYAHRCRSCARAS